MMSDIEMRTAQAYAYTWAYNDYAGADYVDAIDFAAYYVESVDMTIQTAFKEFRATHVA